VFGGCNWENVTDHTIKLKKQYPFITELSGVGTRSSVNAKEVFLNILEESIKHITTVVNEKISLENIGKPQTSPSRNITQADLTCFIGVIVSVCGHRATYFTKHYSNYSDELISYRQWKKIRSAFTYNKSILFECINTGLQAYLNVGGHRAFDEAIWNIMVNLNLLFVFHANHTVLVLEHTSIASV
jgi:hypothetical protein